MKFGDLKKELLKNDNFKKAYFEKDEVNLAIEIGSSILEQRILAGLTQQELANKVNTQQPSIARAENGSQLQSNSFLLKIAHALNIDFIDLMPLKDVYEENSYKIDLKSEAKDEPIRSIYWGDSKKFIKTKIKSSSDNI